MLLIIGLLVLFELFEALLDASVAERVAAIGQQNRKALALIVDLTTKSALNLFYVH